MAAEPFFWPGKGKEELGPSPDSYNDNASNKVLLLVLFFEMKNISRPCPMTMKESGKHTVAILMSYFSAYLSYLNASVHHTNFQCQTKTRQSKVIQNLSCPEAKA